MRENCMPPMGHTYGIKAVFAREFLCARSTLVSGTSLISERAIFSRVDNISFD